MRGENTSSGFIQSWTSSKKESAARELSVIVAASINWPARGVDFFREAGETRSDTGRGPRIVRVGTQR